MPSQNGIRFNQRQAFIDALEARRPFWRKHDEKAAATHKRAEERWFTHAKRTLEKANACETYESLSALVRNSAGDLRLGKEYGLPSCPELMEAKLDEVLAALKITQGQAFDVRGDNGWGQAHRLLTWDPNAKKTVC